MPRRQIGGPVWSRGTARAGTQESPSLSGMLTPFQAGQRGEGCPGSAESWKNPLTLQGPRSVWLEAPATGAPT